MRSDAPQPHAPWWRDLTPAAAAALELPALRTLPTRSVDVAVVGGGVAGLSAALGACAAGADVLLLEGAPRLGEGATGRNAGILSAGINMGLADLPLDGPDAQMWPATTEVLLALVREAQQPDALLQASLTGALSLAESARAARHLAREARARQALGLRAELWTAERAAAATGGRLDTCGVTAALWLPDEGRIHPLTLLAHLAARARAEGAALVGEARVLHYEEAMGGGNRTRWKLTLEGGITLTARGLLEATGPTAAPTARIYALAFHAALPDDFPLFWDAAPFTYADFRPGNGRLTVSGGRYGRAGGSPGEARYHRRLAEAAGRWLPELAGAEPTHAWAVDLAVASDMRPTIRALGARAPSAAIEGLGALGVLPGIVLGWRAGGAVAASL
jgi:gamma-glutamylputrescine oxidase